MADVAHRRKSYGDAADAFLDAWYSASNVTSVHDKIALLEKELGGQSSFYALGGEINDEMKLACLEYEYLEYKGKISLTVA